MAKPNYRFQKQQREMKKNRQQQEKKEKKLARKNPAQAEPAPVQPTATDT